VGNPWENRKNQGNQITETLDFSSFVTGAVGFEPTTCGLINQLLPIIIGYLLDI